jgi:murein L,D-transpeptidase YafK
MRLCQPVSKTSAIRFKKYFAWGVLSGALFCVLQFNAFGEEGVLQKQALGPTAPIGHTLKNPEVQKKVESLLLTRKNEIQNTLKLPVEVSPSLPPLKEGQYGFAEPSQISGVPKAFVSLGNVVPSYGVVVEKLHNRLSVIRFTKDKEFEVIRTFRAITGKDPGDKAARGDYRTPEGIYFVTGKMGKGLPPKYGRMAFTLDYPNIFDQRQRKSGYGIWIHATDDPQRLLRPFDTEGCVALSNEDISELEKYISPFETPIVITKVMTTTSFEELEKPRTGALEMVEAWRKGWEASDFEEYMSFYSKNFRSLGKSKNQWDNYKRTLSEARLGEIKVKISDPKILAFEDQLLVVFFQDYRTKVHSDFGRKFLYLQWEGDRYRIIAEKWYPASKSETALRALKLPSDHM